MNDIAVGFMQGNITVIGSAKNRHGRMAWLCRCLCSKEMIARSIDLRRGMSGCKSCSHIIHGARKTGKCSAEYKSWSGMISRCENPNNPKYSRYGERGIKVCERWRSSFEDFLSDMGPKPTSKLSIERVDNDGNYEPGNCIWATAKIQGQNKCDSKSIIYQGKPRTLSQIIEMSGTEFEYHTVNKRLNSGWSLENALTIPKYQRGR